MQQSKIGGNIEELEITKPKLARNAKIIHSHYDTHKEWKQDPLGYWLFRVHNGLIQAGFCTRGNIIKIMITGSDSEEIHNTIVREKLVTTLQHAAYIGHELQKAEVALKLNLPYIQDQPINLSHIQHGNRY